MENSNFYKCFTGTQSHRSFQKIKSILKDNKTDINLYLTQEWIKAYMIIYR
jgi:hypothetical protein